MAKNKDGTEVDYNELWDAAYELISNMNDAIHLTNEEGSEQAIDKMGLVLQMFIDFFGNAVLEEETGEKPPKKVNYDIN